MNQEIDFTVQADRTSIVAEIVASNRAFLDVFRELLAQTTAEQDDQEFDRIMDSRCKAKLIDYLQSPLVKQQILEKVMQDPIIQEYYECFDNLEQNTGHSAKSKRRQSPKEVYELFLSSLRAKCRKGASFTMKEDYITIANQASKCFKPKGNHQNWDLKLPTSLFKCGYCEQQFSSSSGLKAHENAVKHCSQQKELAEFECQDEEEDA